MKPLNILIFTMLIVLSFFILIIARDFLIPMVMAVFIWYLINVLAATIQKIRLGRFRIPGAVSYFISVILILAILTFIINLITSNIAQVVAAAPTYQKNIERISQPATVFLQEKINLNPDQLFSDINLTTIISKIAGGLTGLVSNAGLITLYIFFIFLEQKYFRNKLNALTQNKKRYHEVIQLIKRVDTDVKTYIGIKTLVSALTAVLGYLVMSIVGLDLAEFWAFLLFILNFIPNIGSLLATALPSLLALIQFNTYTPFIIVLSGILGVQLVVANIVEPRLMGQSLNLSPLVIILSLVIWGTVWGIPGMFLCVPLTVVMMIIFSHFPKTRPIAIMLSRAGRLSQ